MAKITRQTQKIFGSTAGVNQIAEFGSLQAGTPTFTTSIATIQSLSNWLTGWFGAVIGGNSPAIEDMNAMCYVFAYQLAYILQQGVQEWDSGTTYYAGGIVNNLTVVFIVTSANATVGATYTNNSQTFTVQSTISGGVQLVCTATDLPAASGVLTKATGTGDSTITFSSYAVTNGIYISQTDNNLNNALTDTTNWKPYIPYIGKLFQNLAVDVTGLGLNFTYSTINAQTADSSLSVSNGYNLVTGFLTVPSGMTYTVAGSMCVGGKLQATGTGIVQATGNGVIHGF